MSGLPSTGQWEVVNFGILRAKNTTTEYVEDRGNAPKSSYWHNSLLQ